MAGREVMWRWVMVMLLLANALVFFWYAQQNPGLNRSGATPLPSQTALQLVDDSILSPKEVLESKK